MLMRQIPMDFYLLCSRYPPIYKSLPLSFVSNACSVLTLIVVENKRVGKRLPQVPLHRALFFNWLAILSGGTSPSPDDQDSGATLNLRLINTDRTTTSKNKFRMMGVWKAVAAFVPCSQTGDAHKMLVELSQKVCVTALSKSVALTDGCWTAMQHQTE